MVSALEHFPAILFSSALWFLFATWVWKRRVRDQANFDTANSLLRSLYRFRDEIIYARLRHMTRQPVKNLEGSGDIRPALIQAYRDEFWSRWEKVAKAGEKFEAKVTRAEALWGDTGAKIKSKATYLRRSMNQWRDAAFDCAEMLADSELELGNDSSRFQTIRSFSLSPKLIRSDKTQYGTVFAAEEDDHQFLKGIADAIKSIEEATRKKVN